MRRSLMLIAAVLTAPVALAFTQAELDAAKQAAIDRANAASNLDLGDNSGGRPTPGEMGQPPATNYCVGSMNRPSLLGVQADMGPGASPDTRGMSSRLGPGHPLQQERARLDAQINGSRDVVGLKRQADADLRALYGANPTLQRASWSQLNWQQEANGMADSIVVNERIQRETRQRIGEILQTIAALRADEPQINRDFWAKELADKNAVMAKLQAEMGVCQQLLPQLQQGAARYKATVTPLLVQLQAAEKNVAAEAARCP